MEYYNEHGFLDEVICPGSGHWDISALPFGMNQDLYTKEFDFDFPICHSNNALENYSFPVNDQTLNCLFNEFNTSFGEDELSSSSKLTDSSSCNNFDSTPQFPFQDDYNSVSFNIVDEDHLQFLQNLGLTAPCKAEPVQPADPPVFNMGTCPEIKYKPKKLNGQPSKNLMAERRRRKRLNDRLSMLRSVVPKISKMDRTSILGDTIDYMKELLVRINNLQEETDVGSDQLRLMSIFKDVKPNEMLVRTAPKFDVERRNIDTKIEICCEGKPGLLLSTVTTLEALGLDIQHCVISCFNDFAMQASCSEEFKQRAILSSDDIKQALFRNAGYGGRCL